MDKDQLRLRLLETFLVEANEHICAIIDGLLKIEKNPSHADYSKIVEVLHREAHSLKGAARAVDYLDIELICHAVEKIFLSWKTKGLAPTQAQFDILHKTFNILQTTFIHAETHSLSVDPSIATDLVAYLNDTLNSEGDLKSANPKAEELASQLATNHEPVPTAQTVRIASSKLDSLLLKAEEMLLVKQVNQKYIDELAKMMEPLRLWKSEWNKLRQDSSETLSADFLEANFDRIKMIESQMLSLHSLVKADGRQLTGLIDALLEDAKEVVMLPFSSLLDSFPAMVRNISREQDKDVNFSIEGSEIRMDKRILDELKDPLIHLVRNAVDHGIEKKGERKNKPAQGRINLTITQSGGNEVAISISDDGRGIDLAAIKHAAVKLGYLSQDLSQSLEDKDALMLIYQSGVSTSAAITKVSGQGLGMAIVHEKIEKMGGYISVHSSPKGTEIKITVPLSLTTFKAVLIKEVDQAFLLPTTHLDRVIRIREQDVKTVENQNTILLDSKTIPLLKLSQILGLTEDQEGASDSEYLLIAVITVGEQSLAMQVDDIQGQQEVLVKKFTKPLINMKYISSSTILESGLPVPILNAGDLIKAITHGVVSQQIKNYAEETKNSESFTILVVEDSITTRMLLKNILEMAGYQVLTAVDGADAWRVLHETEIGLVVSDVEMPRMNGFELTKRIRNDESLKSLPVILVTTLESPEDREYGIDVGANAYLLKSNFNDSQIVSVIKRLI